MDDFTVRVVCVVLNLARKLFGADEHRQWNAVGNAWYMYQQSPRRLEMTATAWAWVGCRWELSGRDIPGTGRSGRRSDALDRPDTWTVGAMNDLVDKGPGPERIAAYREILAMLTEGMDDETEIIVQGMLTGVSNNEIARQLGITPSAATQRRQRLVGPYLD